MLSYFFCIFTYFVHSVFHLLRIIYISILIYIHLNICLGVGQHFLPTFSGTLSEKAHKLMEAKEEM